MLRAAAQAVRRQASRQLQPCGAGGLWVGAASLWTEAHAQTAGLAEVGAFGAGTKDGVRS